MREVTAIEPKWLTGEQTLETCKRRPWLTRLDAAEVAPTFFKVADQNTISRRKKNERIQPLFDKYAVTQVRCSSPMLLLRFRTAL